MKVEIEVLVLDRRRGHHLRHLVESIELLALVRPRNRAGAQLLHPAVEALRLLRMPIDSAWVSPAFGSAAKRLSRSGQWSSGSRRTCSCRRIRDRCYRQCPQDSGSAIFRRERWPSRRRPLPRAADTRRRWDGTQCRPVCRKRCRYGRDRSYSRACRQRNGHSHRRSGGKARRGIRSPGSLLGLRRSQKCSMKASRSSSLLRLLKALSSCR